MIVRVSFLVLASVSAFAVSQININSSRKRNNAIKPSENDDSRFQQEGFKGEEEEKFAESNSSVEERKEEEVGEKCRSKMKQDMKPNLQEKRDFEKLGLPIHDKKLNNVTKTKLLQKQMKELEQRKVTLEGKLLELCGLREHQSYIAQLQRHLQAKTAEMDMLNMTINLLQAERKELHEEIKRNLLGEKQLEMAKKRIMEMQAKMLINANQIKGRLMMLKEQVSGFQREEETSIRDATAAKKLKTLKDVELEVAEMKRRNIEIQLEKRELTVKLVTAEARIIELSNKKESEIIAKVEEEISSLRHANEHLSKQVERLQKNRFGVVEELVYQRWLNACLKFEIQNYQTPSRKTSKRSLSTNLSQASHEKTSDSNSSLASSPESDESDGTTFYSSSSSHSLIHKINCRFSTSMVRSIKSMQRIKGDSTIITSSRKKEEQDSTESPEAPSFHCVRRVSFSDSVKTFPLTFQDMPKSVEGVLDEKKTSGEIKVVHTEELHSRMPTVLPNDNKVETKMVHLITAFFFFLFILIGFTKLDTCF